MTRATTAFPALTEEQEALRNIGWGIEEIGPDEHVYVRPGRINRADGGELGTDWLWEIQEALEIQDVLAAAEEVAKALAAERREANRLKREQAARS